MNPGRSPGSAAVGFQGAGRSLHKNRCRSVEGAHGVGRALAKPLVGDGELVVDVPAKLAARVRVLSVGHGRKTDPDGAVSVAVAAQGSPGLRRVGVEGHAVVLRLLTNRREDLVTMRTQTINRLHRLLMALLPTGARRNLTASRAAALLTQVTPTGIAAITRCQLAHDLIGDVRDLDQRIAAIEARIKVAVAQSKTSLVELFGVGPVLAAKLLGEVGDIRRFPTEHHFAVQTGTAPLEASSGQVVRHRLSRSGDRKLNHALYMMAMVQIRHPTPWQAYYRRKRAEGKSAKEALRCPKRRLSDAIYRCLLTDQLAPAPGHHDHPASTHLRRARPHLAARQAVDGALNSR